MRYPLSCRRRHQPCFIGLLLLLLLGARPSGGTSAEKQEPAEVDNALVWVLAACVMGQFILLALCFLVGYQIGKWQSITAAADPPVTAAAGPPVVVQTPATDQATLEVHAAELTIEALRARLKSLGIPQTGLKEELVERLEQAMIRPKLTKTTSISRSGSRPRAGIGAQVID